MEVSPAQFSNPSHILFRSSVHSVYDIVSSLLAGSRDTNSLICASTSDSDATTSTSPASPLWKAAEEVSHLEISFPSIALGEFTNNFAFFSSIKVKSVRPGTTARPPPHVPKIAVIWGITPEAFTCFI